MNTLRFIAVAAALALPAAATLAEATAPSSAASQPTKAMRDCDKPRHDHGAEKGVATPKSVRCAKRPAKAASKPHDHAKFHK
jgi:putative hemolysin